MKKFLVLVVLTFSLLIGVSYAAGLQGCCSHHKGVSHCGSNGYVVCNDGWKGSSCKCGGSSSSSSSYTNSYTNSLNSYTYYADTKDTECKRLYGNQAYSTYNGECACNYGYVLNKGLNGVKRCLTYDENCQAMHGAQAYHIGNSSCGCRNGYEMVNWKCVSKSESCKVTYGENSYFDTYYNSCLCNNGYVMSNGKCISETESCKLSFGMQSIAVVGQPGYCTCIDGYYFNSKRDRCISASEWCQDKFGSYSFLSSQGSCICKPGYEMGTNGCVKISGSCDVYGPNAYITLDNKCACKNGYEWNNNMNYCVAGRNNKLYGGKDFRGAKDGLEYTNMLLDYEDALDSIDVNKVEKAKQYLGNNKVKELESMADTIVKKGGKAKTDVLNLIKQFKNDKDEYTRNVGIYLEYLVN